MHLSVKILQPWNIKHLIWKACFFKSTENISASTGLIFTIFLPHERYLREFSRSGPLFPIPQGTLQWQPMLGKICEMTFIQHAGVSKRIRLSQFRIKKIQWQYFLYILCTFDQDWSSNPRDYEGKNYTLLAKPAKIGISYQISQHVRDWSQPQFQCW